jgi:hypothetical protein
MSEEKIAFTIFTLIIDVLSLGIFRINPFFAITITVFSLAFWWTLFFVLFGN